MREFDCQKLKLFGQENIKNCIEQFLIIRTTNALFPITLTLKHPKNHHRQHIKLHATKNPKQNIYFHLHNPSVRLKNFKPNDKDISKETQPVHYVLTDHICNMMLHLKAHHNSQHSRGVQISCKHNIEFPGTN